MIKCIICSVSYNSHLENIKERIVMFMKKGIRRIVPAALSGVMLFSASFSGWTTDVNVFISPSVVYAASEEISDFSISDVKMTDQYVTNAFSL